MSLSRKTIDYIKAWGPAALLFTAIVACGVTFAMMIAAAPSSGWAAIPFFLGVLGVPGTVSTVVFWTVPRHRLATRKWGNMEVTEDRKRLKNMRKNRRKYISYMNSNWNDKSDREMYYRKIIELEKEIGELTGKGYDVPENEPNQSKTYWG